MTGLAALAASISAQSANAEPVDDAAKAFGAREAVQSVSLSPDGNKIAYIASDAGHGDILFVADIAAGGEAKPIFSVTEDRAGLNGCTWTSESRLICRLVLLTEQAGLFVGYSRMVALDADGNNFKVLTHSPSSRALTINQNGGSVIALDVGDSPDEILMTRTWVPESDLNTRIANKIGGLGVDRVNTKSGRTSKVEGPDPDAVAYFADGTGNVRILVRHPSNSAGNMGTRELFYYRALDQRDWRPLSKINVDAQSFDGFMPVAVDEKQNVAFGFDRNGKGYLALYSVSLDDAQTRKQVLARDDADVDDLIRIGRHDRVVGASYATERRMVEYFDPQLAALASGLAKALPGSPQINIVDASDGEGKLLIVASGDSEPGKVYLFDKATYQLGELLSVRPQLAGRTLSEMKPVTFPASDGVEIPGYLTLPAGKTSAAGLPGIVLPHGGPSARDEWGFDWLVQFFASQGYAVLQPNFRGSAGYGAAWFGGNGFRDWRTSIGDVNDAGRWLVRQGAAPGKLAVVGWSYGGYAALESQVIDPDLFKAVVAVAPVADIDRLRQDARPYTSSTLIDRFVGNIPDEQLASPARNAVRFKAPVLLAHGTDDQAVDIGQSRLMESRLKDAGKSVTLLEFEKLGHSLDDGQARAKLLADIARFLQASLNKQ